MYERLLVPFALILLFSWINWEKLSGAYELNRFHIGLTKLAVVQKPVDSLTDSQHIADSHFVDAYSCRKLWFGGLIYDLQGLYEKRESSWQTIFYSGCSLITFI
jgi:hypothetical protein